MAQAGGGGGGGWGDPAIHHVAPAPAGMGGWGWAAVLEAKGPVQKKLFLRLYYELQYPLWEAALKKILPEELIAGAVAASLKISEGIPPS